jgi:hypothetical protein
MFRSLFIALVSTMLIASVASAAPQSLMKGHWSLGYSPSSEQQFILGIGMADMTKAVIAASFQNLKGADVTAGGQTTEGSSFTTFSIGGAFHYYLDGLSTDAFAPFIGGGFTYEDSGLDTFDPSDPSLEYGDVANTIRFDARFGGEAFAVEPLSIGGWVGVEFEKPLEVTATDNAVYKGNWTINSFRSAIFATLYWGG